MRTKYADMWKVLKTGLADVHQEHNRCFSVTYSILKHRPIRCRPGPWKMPFICRAGETESSGHRDLPVRPQLHTVPLPTLALALLAGLGPAASAVARGKRTEQLLSGNMD